MIDPNSAPILTTTNPNANDAQPSAPAAASAATPAQPAAQAAPAAPMAPAASTATPAPSAPVLDQSSIDQANAKANAPVASQASQADAANAQHPDYTQSPEVTARLNNMAQQAKPYVPGLVNGTLVAIPSGLGDKATVTIYKKSDLMQRLNQEVDIPTYPSKSFGPDGKPIAEITHFIPDNRTTLMDVYNKFQQGLGDLQQMHIKAGKDAQVQQTQTMYDNQNKVYQDAIKANGGRENPAIHDLMPISAPITLKIYSLDDKGNVNQDVKKFPIGTSRGEVAAANASSNAVRAQQLADQKAEDTHNLSVANAHKANAGAGLDEKKLNEGPFDRILEDPSKLNGEGAASAIASANEALSNPNTSPSDRASAQRVLSVATNAQRGEARQKANEKASEQAISQGDPEAAGKMLAEGTLTIQELKSRSVTPQFILKATQAAQRYDRTFLAPQAEADAKIAGSESNQAFIGNIDSLITRGGTLDQLQDAKAALGSTKIPIYNSVDQARQAAFGSGPLAAYAAAVVGAADDYGKVMAGSTGSDTARKGAADLFAKNLSPEGLDAAVGQVRQQVLSQRSGRIGNNRYLKAQHPVPEGADRSNPNANAPAANAPAANAPSAPVTKTQKKYGF